jgi:glycosyltransferase involved in cell wall biosynthesis
MKILFVAEQFVPPIYDGSTTVYHSWLKALKSVGDVYAILFTLKETPGEETHSFLRQTCRDYLILRGRNQSSLLKTARALGRFVNGCLFAPPLIEEFGRRPVKIAISQFLAAHKPDLALVSKLECVHLLGLDVLSSLRIPKFMDLHDDHVARERLVRQALRDALAQFPSLINDRYYQLKRMRNRLSRHDDARARRQECRLLKLFDRIMIASYEEYLAYAAMEEIGDRCVHVPWPIEVDINPIGRCGVPEFDAGLIAATNEFNLEGMAFLVREVLPLIRKQRPDFRLLVAGSIADTFSITGLPTEGLTLAGTVKDLSEFYSRIRVSLVPLLNGTGVSLKTLEGIRYGLPVVATPMGARGLGGQDLPNLYVADTPETFANTALSLLDHYPVATDASNGNGSNGSSNDQWKRFLRICDEVGIK